MAKQEEMPDNAEEQTRAHFMQCPRFEPFALLEQRTEAIYNQLWGIDGGLTLRELITSYATTAETERVKLESKINAVYTVCGVLGICGILVLGALRIAIAFWK